MNYDLLGWHFQLGLQTLVERCHLLFLKVFICLLLFFLFIFSRFNLFSFFSYWIQKGCQVSLNIQPYFVVVTFFAVTKPKRKGLKGRSLPSSSCLGPTLGASKFWRWSSWACFKSVVVALLSLQLFPSFGVAPKLWRWNEHKSRWGR